MPSREVYLKEQQGKLVRALEYLDYSYKKIIKHSVDSNALDEESLETWESFSARFSRVADIFLMRYVRAYVLLNDSGFSGSLRDFVNQAEKLSLIENALVWMGIRELHNISDHEYSDKDLSEFFRRLKEESQVLLGLKEKLCA